uniref:Uncharacterized protein n=1 Tax=Panagrellus redivivus TaxID=6233 RepID=A0A7E4UY12_PANRE
MLLPCRRAALIVDGKALLNLDDYQASGRGTLGEDGHCSHYWNCWWFHHCASVCHFDRTVDLLESVSPEFCRKLNLKCHLQESLQNIPESSALKNDRCVYAQQAQALFVSVVYIVNEIDRGHRMLQNAEAVAVLDIQLFAASRMPTNYTRAAHKKHLRP